MLEGKLERFVMEDDETSQAMYDRMMVLVNKIRGLGSEELDDHKVDDHKVVRRLLGRRVTIENTRETCPRKEHQEGHAMNVAKLAIS